MSKQAKLRVYDATGVALKYIAIWALLGRKPQYTSSDNHVLTGDHPVANTYKDWVRGTVLWSVAHTGTYDLDAVLSWACKTMLIQATVTRLGPEDTSTWISATATPHASPSRARTAQGQTVIEACLRAIVLAAWQKHEVLVPKYVMSRQEMDDQDAAKKLAESVKKGGPK